MCSPGFPEGILGGELTEKFRAQSARFGTQIFTETVTSVDLSQRPFSIVTDDREVICQCRAVALCRQLTDQQCCACGRMVAALCII